MITIKFSHYEDGEPVFNGEYNSKAFRCIFVPTDIDYGWHRLSYLPTYEASEDGWDNFTDDEYDTADEWLNNQVCELLLEAA